MRIELEVKIRDYIVQFGEKPNILIVPIGAIHALKKKLFEDNLTFFHLSSVEFIDKYNGIDIIESKKAKDIIIY